MSYFFETTEGKHGETLGVVYGWVVFKTVSSTTKTTLVVRLDDLSCCNYYRKLEVKVKVRSNNPQQ